jgi:hypothetical protein
MQVIIEVRPFQVFLGVGGYLVHVLDNCWVWNTFLSFTFLDLRESNFKHHLRSCAIQYSLIIISKEPA